MPNSYIFEGKTTNEAIEKGLKELKVSKEKVEIKVLEQEEKRNFFSILTPRVVKVEMKLKQRQASKEVKKKEEKIDNETLEMTLANLKSFLDSWVKKLPSEKVEYSIKKDETFIEVEFKGEDINYLIGYRGETLNSIQVILNAIANKNLIQRVRVVVDILGYRQKREKILEDLAEKIAKTVIKNKKSITLEPMSAFERKIIHSKLQNHPKVKTTSIGEEPHRKVVISIK